MPQPEGILWITQQFILKICLSVCSICCLDPLTFCSSGKIYFMWHRDLIHCLPIYSTSVQMWNWDSAEKSIHQNISSGSPRRLMTRLSNCPYQLWRFSERFPWKTQARNRSQMILFIEEPSSECFIGMVHTVCSMLQYVCLNLENIVREDRGRII